MADHGITVLTQREGMTFQSPIQSDTAPLNHLVHKIMAETDQIHVLRDPTRGGVGTSLNEIAAQSKVGIEIYEDAIPIREEVSGICELLGFDPLYIANEGKLLAFVGPDTAEGVLKTMKESEYGNDASIIGKVVTHSPGMVFMKTRIGGTRIVDMLTGEQLPRIC
jgi:hydrogenase expression/formation protein HypE